MGWKIIKDSLATDTETNVNRESKYEPYRGGKYQVRTFDDDGTLYYTALCDGENSAEAFHDWSVYDSGTSYSEVREKGNKKWEPFIG